MAAVRATGVTPSCTWAESFAQLETLNHELQARTPHPLMGSGSLHASIVSGGRELSSYADWCKFQEWSDVR